MRRCRWSTCCGSGRLKGKVFDSPERRAALDKQLKQKIKLIQDPSIRSHYGEAIKELRFQLFRPQRGGAAFGGRHRKREMERRATGSEPHQDLDAGGQRRAGGNARA